MSKQTIHTRQHKATLYEITEANYKSEEHYEDGTHQRMETEKVGAVSEFDLFKAIEEGAESEGFKKIDSDEDSITCTNPQGRYRTYTAEIEEDGIVKIILGLNFKQ
mgnify:CR=1 FL=1